MNEPSLLDACSILRDKRWGLDFRLFQNEDAHFNNSNRQSGIRALVVALLRGALRMLRASTSKHWLAFTTKYVRTNVHKLWKGINERVRFSPSSNLRTS